MGIISILLIAVGLAMDSLAVSISGGIVMRPFCMRQSLRPVSYTHLTLPTIA